MPKNYVVFVLNYVVYITTAITFGKINKFCFFPFCFVDVIYIHYTFNLYSQLISTYCLLVKTFDVNACRQPVCLE